MTAAIVESSDDAILSKTLEGIITSWNAGATRLFGYTAEEMIGQPIAKLIPEELLSEEQDILAKLRRGGHDYRKLYAAYKAATEHKGAPTVILAKTVKGWTLGPGVEARNITHQAKKLSESELRVFRDRLELPIPDAKLKDAPYYHPGPDSDEVQYLRERRRQLPGHAPGHDSTLSTGCPRKPSLARRNRPTSLTRFSTTASTIQSALGNRNRSSCACRRSSSER